MIVKIEVAVSTTYVGSRVTDIVELEIDDDATEAEIEKIKEEYAKEWMFNNIDWGWKDVD